MGQPCISCGECIITLGRKAIIYTFEKTMFAIKNFLAHVKKTDQNFHMIRLELSESFWNFWNFACDFLERFASYSCHFMGISSLKKCWRQQKFAKNDVFCQKCFIQLPSKGTLYIKNPLPLNFQSIIVWYVLFKKMFANNCSSKSIKIADQSFTDQLFQLKDQIKENVVTFFPIKLHVWNVALY